MILLSLATVTSYLAYIYSINAVYQYYFIMFNIFISLMLLSISRRIYLSVKLNNLIVSAIITAMMVSYYLTANLLLYCLLHIFIDYEVDKMVYIYNVVIFVSSMYVLKKIPDLTYYVLFFTTILNTIII